MTPLFKRRRGCLIAAACAAALAGPAGAGQPAPPPPRPALSDLPLPPEVPPPVIAGTAHPKGRERYLPMAAAVAKEHGLPPEVADAVMFVESGYDPGAVGGVGERGLMQVLPSTATMLGFSGPTEGLADPATNIRLGVRYLAGAWKLAGGDLCRALMKYRAGHNEVRMSALSVEYCRRAKIHLASIGSPLAAGPLPAPEFGVLRPLGPVAGRVAGRRAGGRLVAVDSRRTSRKFWAAHTARIKAIEARLPWKRGGIMAGG